MKPIFPTIVARQGLWLRSVFVAVIVLLFIVVAWTSFEAAHEKREPRAKALAGCNGPLGGIGR